MALIDAASTGLPEMRGFTALGTAGEIAEAEGLRKGVLGGPRRPP